MTLSIKAHPQSENEESLLIRRICNGEVGCFEDLVRPYERVVYVTAISILRNQGDAEEVAQEAILKAFAKLSSFRGECKFSTWLIQITYNEAKMRLRKDRRHLYESVDDLRQGDEGDYAPRDFADWRPIPSELLESRQVVQALEDAINSLSVRYREVVNFRDMQGLSIKETATLLGIPEASVKTRLHRARLQLRDTLAPGIRALWNTTQDSQKNRP